MTFDEWLDEPQTTSTRRNRAARYIGGMTYDERMELYFWCWLKEAYEAGKSAKTDKEGTDDASC